MHGIVCLASPFVFFLYVLSILAFKLHAAELLRFLSAPLAIMHHVSNFREHLLS